MKNWQTAPALTDPLAREHFASIDKVFQLTGAQITRDTTSELIRIETPEQAYYVKRYRLGGSRLRRWIGRPRVQFEWENLQRFAQWGIPTAEVVAWGMEKWLWLFRRGAVITAEIPGTRSLHDLAARTPEFFGDRVRVHDISLQVAAIARTLHRHRFTHNDLHWRNLLYQADSGKVFLIDCPTGRYWIGAVLRYRIAKDLAALDKIARTCLSRTQRLRFYLAYAGKARLDEADKTMIRRIMHAFDHRLRRKNLLP